MKFVFSISVLGTLLSSGNTMVKDADKSPVLELMLGDGSDMQ